MSMRAEPKGSAVAVGLWTYRARVVAVVDGDTLDVTLDQGLHTTRTERLRLLAVNAPEVKGQSKPAGLAATAFVRAWLAEAGADEWPLVVRTERADAFGRFLARVWRTSDGACLNDALLAAGQAVRFMDG